jgi:hypothetical protein
MCLPFGGFSEESVPPPNEKSKKLVGILKKLFWIQLILGLCKIIVSFFGIGFSGFGDLISAYFLYRAYNSIDYCNCAIYIISTIFESVISLDKIFGLLQNKSPLFTDSGARNFSMVLTILSLIFYCVAVYFVFQSYKEFKAISYEQGGNMRAQAYERESDDYEMQGQPIGGQPAAAQRGYNQSNNLAPLPVISKQTFFTLL